MNFKTHDIRYTRDLSFTLLSNLHYSLQKMPLISNPAPDTSELARVSIHAKPGELYAVDNPDRTLPDLFEQGKNVTGDGNFLGTNSGNVSNFILIVAYL